MGIRAWRKFFQVYHCQVRSLTQARMVTYVLYLTLRLPCGSHSITFVFDAGMAVYRRDHLEEV